MFNSFEHSLQNYYSEMRTLELLLYYTNSELSPELSNPTHFSLILLENDKSIFN